jgi:hypothetical protein
MHRALVVRAIGIAATALLAAAPIGCERAEPAASPLAAAENARAGSAIARWDVVELMRKGAAAKRHPADGGGRAHLVRDRDQPAYTTRGTVDRFRIVYEVGPLGIAKGGMVQLQVSPFWGWSTPQVDDPNAPGFTEIRPTPSDIALKAATLDEQLLGIEVTGRPLVAGDRIEIMYGAGPARARTDLCRRGSRFWIAVDGDGDGIARSCPTRP